MSFATKRVFSTLCLVFLGCGDATSNRAETGGSSSVGGDRSTGGSPGASDAGASGASISSSGGVLGSGGLAGLGGASAGGQLTGSGGVSEPSAGAAGEAQGGGAAAGQSAAGEGGEGAAAGAGGCGNRVRVLRRSVPGVLVVLDRSASMQDPPDGSTLTTSRWDLLVPELTGIIESSDATIAWGLKRFPEDDQSECGPGSVTTSIDAPIAESNAAIVNPAIRALVPLGNGTPTGDAIRAAVTYLQTLSDARDKYLLLATDGAPSCAGTVRDATQARTYAVQALSDALAAGFPTFVLGIGTSNLTPTNTLNAMAIAGGRPRADANPVATKYYAADTSDQLESNLASIAGSLSSCLFALDSAWPALDSAQVRADGTLIPRDSSHANGWDYSDAPAHSLQLFGAACNNLAATASVTLEAGDCG